VVGHATVPIDEGRHDRPEVSMKLGSNGWQAGAKGVLVSLALVVLGYQIVKPQYAPGLTTADAGVLRATASAAPVSSALADPSMPAALPGPNAAARSQEFPLECVPQEGLAIGCVYH